MKKGLKKFLLVILALFLAYQVDDFFWQRDREGKVERVINAMRDSVGEIEAFLRENEDDLVYLVTRCAEDDLAIYDDNVHLMGKHEEIITEPELLSRRDRLIANLPSDIYFYHIYDTGMYFKSKDAVFETPMYTELSSPQLSEHTGSYVAGSIGTIELKNTWTVNVVVYDYWDWCRACKIMGADWVAAEKELKETRTIMLIALVSLPAYWVYHSSRQRRRKEAEEQAP